MKNTIFLSVKANGPTVWAGGFLASAYTIIVGILFIQAIRCSGKRAGGGLGGIWGCDFELWVMTAPWSYLFHRPLELLSAYPPAAYALYSLFLILNAVGLYFMGLWAGKFIHWIIS